MFSKIVTLCTTIFVKWGNNKKVICASLSLRYNAFHNLKPLKRKRERVWCLFINWCFVYTRTISESPIGCRWRRAILSHSFTTDCAVIAFKRIWYLPLSSSSWVTWNAKTRCVASCSADQQLARSWNVDYSQESLGTWLALDPVWAWMWIVACLESTHTHTYIFSGTLRLWVCSYQGRSKFRFVSCLL